MHCTPNRSGDRDTDTCQTNLTKLRVRVYTTRESVCVCMHSRSEFCEHTTKPNQSKVLVSSTLARPPIKKTPFCQNSHTTRPFRPPASRRRHPAKRVLPVHRAHHSASNPGARRPDARTQKEEASPPQETPTAQQQGSSISSSSHRSSTDCRLFRLPDPGALFIYCRRAKKRFQKTLENGQENLRYAFQAAADR